MKLTKKDIENWQKLEDDALKAKNKILDRIDEIFTIILDEFGIKRSKKHYWYFSDANEGEVGTLCISGGYIDWCPQGVGDLSTDNECFSDSFPFAFLTMTDDQIRKYINEEISLTKQNEEREQSEKIQIAEKAKKKLSKKEREVLGIN